MDRVFRSQVSWVYYLLLAIMVILCAIVVMGQNVWAIVITFLLTALVVHIFLSTNYVITEGGTLIASCGIFPKKVIEISQLDAIERSVMPVPSYALSFTRIALWTKEGIWMMVSPKDEAEFVKLLRKHNPDLKTLKTENFI